MHEKPHGAEFPFSPDELSRIPWAESRDEIDGCFRKIASRLEDTDGCLVNVYKDVQSGEIVKITCQDEEEQY